MTSLNQMCEVLLFCVLRWLMRPVLALNCLLWIEREVWGRKPCWYCLSSGFPLSMFLLGFADSFYFVFTSTPSYEASALCTILCNLLYSIDIFWIHRANNNGLKKTGCLHVQFGLDVCVFFCFFFKEWVSYVIIHVFILTIMTGNAEWTHIRWLLSDCIVCYFSSTSHTQLWIVEVICSNFL